MSLAILELQEGGKIHVLYNKWWKATGTCNRDENKKESKANALGVENVGGIFVVLLAGLALAVIVALIEFTWSSKRNASEDRVSKVCTKKRLHENSSCQKSSHLVSWFPEDEEDERQRGKHKRKKGKKEKIIVII